MATDMPGTPDRSKKWATRSAISLRQFSGNSAAPPGGWHQKKQNDDAEDSSNGFHDGGLQGWIVGWAK
jgi:hypothetical protein